MDDSESTISIDCHTPNYWCDVEKTRRLASTILAELLDPGGQSLASYGVAITLLDQSSMRDLNLTYRNKLGSTDVLSFPQVDWTNHPVALVPTKLPTLNSFPRHLRSIGSATESTGSSPPQLDNNDAQPPKTLGDIVISLEDTQSNATAIGHGLDREFAFLLIHGFLHLGGHDHQTPAEELIMESHQQALLERIGANRAGRADWADCVVPGSVVSGSVVSGSVVSGSVVSGSVTPGSVIPSNLEDHSLVQDMGT